MLFEVREQGSNQLDFVVLNQREGCIQIELVPDAGHACTRQAATDAIKGCFTVVRVIRHLRAGVFVELGADDEQLDFPIIYASAINGVAGLEADDLAEDMTPLFQMITDSVPAPDVDRDGPFQMQISALDYDSYVGVIGVGRITRGSLKPNQTVVVKDADGNERKSRWRPR